MDIAKATKEDLEFLVDLRNEEANVRFSRRGVITSEEAEKDYFHNPTKQPFIAREEGVPVGYVIFEDVGDSNYEISVALAPEQRGRRKGTQLIKDGSEFCLDNLGAEKVLAEIFPENEASLRAFEGADFQPVHTPEQAPGVLWTYSFTREDTSDQKTKNYIWCTYRDWSFRMLEGIQGLDGWENSLIVTTPDCSYDFKKLEEQGIEVLRVNPSEDLKEGGKAYERILELKPDAIFHNGWSWVVPNEVLDLCPNVTFHPGKLPKDRGGSPIQNQIRNGETWTYVNVMELAEGLDEGPVYLKEKISLDGTAEDVWSRMTATGCVLAQDFLKRLEEGNFEPAPQADEEPTLYKRVKPAKARLRPGKQSAEQMHNIVRAHYETDPNTYVVPAYFAVGDKRVVAELSTLDSELVETDRPTVILNHETDAPSQQDLVKICSDVNNGKYALALQDANREKVYLTRVRLQLR